MLHLQAGIEAVRLPLAAQAGRRAQGRRLPREGLEPIDVSHSAAWPKGSDTETGVSQQEPGGRDGARQSLH